MKITIHQKIALWWLFGSLWVFVPVLENSPLPNVGAVLAWGIAEVAMMILFTPFFLRWPLLRRWYGWTDAMSDAQRQALAQKDSPLYYQTAFDDGYPSRVLPYLKRMIYTIVGLTVVTIQLPNNFGHPALDAFIAFWNWYPFGVVLFVLASTPLVRMVKKRFKRSS